jgi:dephospho-CoA kinase
VFSDGEKRRLLNSIVHPLVYAQLEVLKEKARREGEKAVVLDIPLLFETGYEKQCDETWLVWLDEEDQRRRLMLRDNMEKRQAIARINAQMPMCAKRQKATRIIDNSQAAEHTYKQVSELWENVNA